MIREIIRPVPHGRESRIRLRLLDGMADRARIFERMVSEKRAGIVQYSLPRPSLAAWMEDTAQDRAWFHVLEESGREAAAVWLTNFTGRAAFYHFVVFRGYGHLSRAFCHLSCRWIFSGGLACLMGVIPGINRAALAAMRASGWREVFRIPQACYVHRLGRHVDGALCHFTPQLLQEAGS